jgi:murein DD-endopeptidase MepM/ murein hydrolase activator NlpD
LARLAALFRFGEGFKRIAQAVAGAGLVVSAAGLYLQTRSLRSDVATLEVQAEQLKIEKRKLELDEEAALRAQEAAERERAAAESEQKAEKFAQAQLMFSLANEICTLANPSEMNSRLKLLTQLAPDTELNATFCVSYRGGGAFSGTIAWPVTPEAEITGKFGPVRNPILGTVKQHNGIDFVSPDDPTVRAAADGVVAFADYTEGYGRHIVLDHGNGWRTSYSHLSQIRCAAGDIVLTGQPIGRIGASGLATGPHLHFEVKKGSEALDPEALLPKPG